MSDSRARRIERNVADIRAKLAPWAPYVAARYNAPVYLVGSTLYNPQPRDCDIRIPINDYEFAARYGMPTVTFAEAKGADGHRWVSGVEWGGLVAPTQAWVDDIAKFTGHLSTYLKRNVDLQIWPRSFWRDAYPGALLLCAPSPKWWIYNSYAPSPKRVRVSGPKDTETP